MNKNWEYFFFGPLIFHFFLEKYIIRISDTNYANRSRKLAFLLFFLIYKKEVFVGLINMRSLRKIQIISFIFWTFCEKKSKILC